MRPWARAAGALWACSSDRQAQTSQAGAEVKTRAITVKAFAALSKRVNGLGAELHHLVQGAGECRLPASPLGYVHC